MKEYRVYEYDNGRLHKGCAFKSIHKVKYKYNIVDKVGILRDIAFARKKGNTCQFVITLYNNGDSKIIATL